MKTALALAALLAAAPASAQPARSAPPPLEALAAIPDLSFAQQIALRRILVEQHEATLRQLDKHRGDMDRIQERTATRVHDLLGDEGYRHYAQWRGATDRPPPAPGAGPRPPLPPRAARGESDAPPR